MEVGQSDKLHIGFIIQARMGSSRLPGKVLLPMPVQSNKTVLGRIVNELSQSKFSGEIIVATSTNPEDDAIEIFCQNFGIQIYRGSVNDVLSRFVNIINLRQFDIVVRITADNPLVDHLLLDELIDIHVNHRNDFTCSTGLPLGMNMEMVNPLVLQNLKTEELSESDKEHVTISLKYNPSIRKEVVQMENSPTIGALRLTLDYPSDYVVLSAVLSVSDQTNIKGIIGVKTLFNKYPWLFQANSNCIQK